MDHETDKLLDAVLRRYSAAEPRPGLETRIVANLRSAPEPARFAWLRWTAAAALVAAVVIVAIVVTHRPAPRAISNTPSAIAPAPRPSTSVKVATGHPAPPPARKPISPKANAAVAIAKVEGRPAQFPSPSPLTREEEALLRFSQRAPEPVLLAAVSQPGPPQALMIPEVAIAPVVLNEIEIQPIEK